MCNVYRILSNRSPSPIEAPPLIYILKNVKMCNKPIYCRWYFISFSGAYYHKIQVMKACSGLFLGFNLEAMYSALYYTSKQFNFMYCYIRNVQDRQVGHTTVSLSCLFWNLEHLLEKNRSPPNPFLKPRGFY